MIFANSDVQRNLELIRKLEIPVAKRFPTGDNEVELVIQSIKLAISIPKAELTDMNSNNFVIILI